MNNIKKYLVAFVMMLSMVGFVGCGNNDAANDEMNESMNETVETTNEMTTETTTNRTDRNETTRRSGNVNSSTDTNGDGVAG